MTVKVAIPFIDKITKEFYPSGKSIQIEDDERIADLAARGLIEPPVIKKRKKK